MKTTGPTTRRFSLQVVLAVLIAAVFASAAGEPPGPGAAAETVFEQMAAAINQVKDYQAEWSHYSATGGGQGIHGLRTSEGKFLRRPRLSWQKFISMQDNFNDPTTPGTQLIYDSRTDELKALLSGVRRLLGVVNLFAEDVKCRWLNGESLKAEGLWDWLELWQARRQTGKLGLRSEAAGGKSYSVLSLSFPVESFGDRAEINRYEIWVDPSDHLPRRCLGFVPGQEKPVLDYHLTRLQTNLGLSSEDIKFEGLSLWNFPAQFVANGKGLDEIKWNYPAPADASSPVSVLEAVTRFSSALARVKDYRADLVFTEKYFRLRSHGAMRASVIKEPFFFNFEFDPDFRINHLHFTSPGAKVCYRREQESIAALGGGVYRMVGVQVMHREDPRTFFPFGESLDELNLFALLDRIQWYAQAGEVSVEMVKLGGTVAPRLILKRGGKPRPAEIQDMAVVLDPGTWLPRRVDYFGNLDPEGFAMVEYTALETNLGLKESELKF